MATFRDTETPDMHEPWRGSVPPGVAQAMLAMLAGLAVIAVPYLIPAPEPDDPTGLLAGAGLEAPGEGDDDEEHELSSLDFRIWLPEDGPPFEGMFDPEGAGFTPAEAAGGAGPRIPEAAGPGPEEPVPEEVPDAGDPAGPSALPEVAGAEPEVAPPPTLVVEPDPDESLEPSEADLQPEPGVAAEPGVASKPPDRANPVKRIRIPATVYDGVSVLIEDPKGAMKPFYEALARTALKDKGAMTRIGHWGDSVIGGDGMTGYARRHLQGLFGDGGHGFVLVDAGTKWYYRKDVDWDSSSWNAKPILNGGVKDGRFGYGGSLALGRLRSSARFGTSDKGPVGHTVSRFEIWHQRGPRFGALTVAVDGGPEELVSMHADAPSDAVHVVEVPDGPHSLKLEVSEGRAALYGVVLEREGPGVVYDSVGMIGTRGARLLNFDPDHLAAQLKQRDLDLLIIHFGGNEVVDKMKTTTYAKAYDELIGLFRKARPDAACLALSPLDHGERHRGRIRSKSRLLRMIPAQREVAFKHGCAYYSVFDAMGGPGSMGLWYKQKLASGDLSHASGRGNVILGERFFKALMKGMADYVAAQPERLPAAQD